MLCCILFSWLPYCQWSNPEENRQMDRMDPLNTDDLLKIRIICHVGISENWLVLVNSCIYYAHQTHEIYQVLP